MNNLETPFIPGSIFNSSDICLNARPSSFKGFASPESCKEKIEIQKVFGKDIEFGAERAYTFFLNNK